MRIVAVTACPTGIAHTYMAAEKLERAAKKLGHDIKVETQGSMGIENALTKKVRYLDKLVDELAKGRKMEKILRGA